MKISIILPNYNHGKYIRDNLEGLLAQTHRDWQLQVVDDGSSDDSAAIIREYAQKDARIKPVFFPENRGVMAAIAVAMQGADGELLYSSAADDYVSNPRFFELAVAALSGSKASGFFGCAALIDATTNEQKATMGHAWHTGYIAPREAMRGFLLSKLFVPGVSSVWRRSLLDQYGGFDASLGAQCDFYLNHTLPAMEGVVFCNEIMATCRMDPASYSASAKDADFFQRHALVEKKLRALPLPYSVPDAWYASWRDGLVTRRLATRFHAEAALHLRALEEKAGAWAHAALSPRFGQLLPSLASEADALHAELTQRIAGAYDTMDATTGIALPRSVNAELPVASARCLALQLNPTCKRKLLRSAFNLFCKLPSPVQRLIRNVVKR
jgi:glycosyltransferase involved in cell wall biosynthesis